MRVGLALSGGGSKGAYQVGMLKAFVELGGQIDAVAGASIGALNAAMIACSRSLEDAVHRLQKLWVEEVPYVNLLGSAFSGRLEVMIDRLGLSGIFEPPALLSKEPVRELLAKYIDYAALENGLPLYASIYESKGGFIDLMRLGMAGLGFMDTARSKFVHVQSLPEDERIECLLASIAIPFFFSASVVQGSRYSDGGQGGWWTQQGNTPVEPLVDGGCDIVVVMHAGEGSPWSRDQHPNTMVMEIPPRHTPSSFPLSDLFESDEKVLSSWIEQGYKDGRKTLGRIMDAVQSRNELRRSKDERAAALRRIEKSEQNKEQAQAQLASVLANRRRRTE